MKPAPLAPVLAIMGPTASGKTGLAIKLGQELDGEIISVDSGLVYREMNIGTAKPTLEERQGVPHHLIDILDPREAFSTGQFCQRALALAADITARGRLPIMAGGTMLYFNALFNGLAELPAADPDVRKQIDLEAARYGWGKLHEQLAEIDPQAAARIHPNDPQRIQRALEVYRLSGLPLSELCARTTANGPQFRFLRLVLSPANREILHERIQRRFLLMLEQGLVEEVERLFRRGDLDETMPSIRAVGYRQVWSYLKTELNYREMVERGIIATRQFAKRQYTWLRREHAALHFDTEDDHLLQNILLEIKPLLG